MARHTLRLGIIVLLSLLVAGAFYGVSLTPVGQSMVSARGGPPAGRGGAPAAAPVAASASADAPLASSSAETGTTAPTTRPAPGARPAGGGGRPSSLARGLPELLVNLSIIAVLIGVVSGSQVWLRARRRPLARRSAA